MAAKSDEQNYGTVAVLIHWTTVLLILALVATGFQAGSAEPDGQKADFLQIHIPLGVAVLLLTLFRIVWWLFADRKPDSIAMPRWQDLMSRLVHLLFYVVILGMAASGIGMIILSGAGPAIFGEPGAELPDFWDFLPRVPHGLGARAILLLFVFHAGAALYHQFVKHDGLLWRMWFGRPSN